MNVCNGGRNYFPFASQLCACCWVGLSAQTVIRGGYYSSLSGRTPVRTAECPFETTEQAGGGCCAKVVVDGFSLLEFELWNNCFVKILDFGLVFSDKVGFWILDSTEFVRVVFVYSTACRSLGHQRENHSKVVALRITTT